jgi:hypothetical protein
VYDYDECMNVYADEQNFRQLVVWLEDEKIRQYPEGQREAIRTTWSEEWPSAFEKYEKDLKLYPMDKLTSREKADLLVSRAVSLQYSDDCKWSYLKLRLNGNWVVVAITNIKCILLLFQWKCTQDYRPKRLERRGKRPLEL